MKDWYFYLNVVISLIVPIFISYFLYKKVLVQKNMYFKVFSILIIFILSYILTVFILLKVAYKLGYGFDR